MNLRSTIYLVVFNCFTFAHAELILLQNTDAGYAPIDFENAPTREKYELEDIYDNIVNRYQFPMLTMYYPSFSREERDAVAHYLERENPMENLVNHFIAKKFGTRYRALYVPTTLFEIAAILTIFTELAREDIGAQKLGEDDKGKDKERPYYTSDLLRSFKAFPKTQEGFFKNYQEKMKQKDPPKQIDLRRAHFLRSTYGQHNVQTDTRRLWFQASLTLLKIAEQDLISGNFPLCLNKLFEEYDRRKATYRDLAKKFNLSLYEFVLYDSTTDVFLGQAGQKHLRNYMMREVAFSSHGLFPLVRATRGLALNDTQQIIDTPYHETRDDFEQSKAHFDEGFGLVSMAQLASAKNEQRYIPHALSFSNSLLSGTFFDASVAGARTLDHLCNEGAFGYLLQIGIKEYLDSDEIKDAFFISPLNSLVSLLASGEYFHSRSKVSFFHEEKLSSDFRIEGVNSGFGESYLPFVYDFAQNIGAFSCHRSWPHLAALITATIATRADFLTGQTGADYGNLTKNQLAVSAIIRETDRVRLKGMQAFESMVPETWNESPIVRLLRQGRVHHTIPLSSMPNFFNYHHENIFYAYAKNSKPVKKIASNDYAFSIADIRPRTKHHVLAMPRNGYVSLPHFSSNASMEELVALFKIISQTAEQFHLDKTGYRIITNHSCKPGSNVGNHAHQEIGHLHFHIAGGELLGRPVALANSYMGVDGSYGESNGFIPWGMGLSHEEFVALVERLQIYSKVIDAHENRLVLYKLPAHASDGVPVYVGATILTKDHLPRFKSIHDFAKSASPSQIQLVLEALSRAAHEFGIDQTGYRVIANHGGDAWQSPRDFFQIFLAGGAPLGITVTNAHGNKVRNHRDEPELDFEDLTSMPHLSLPDGDLASGLMYLKALETITDTNNQSTAKLVSIKNLIHHLETAYEHASLRHASSHETSIPASILVKYVESATTFSLPEKLASAAARLRKRKLEDLQSTLRRSRKTYNELYQKLTQQTPTDQAAANSLREKIDILERMLDDALDSSSYQGITQVHGSSLTKALENINEGLVIIYLDSLFVEDFFSGGLREADVLEKLRALQHRGVAVMGFSYKAHWEDMDSCDRDFFKSIGYQSGRPRDPFQILRALDKDFAFSNPKSFPEGYFRMINEQDLEKKYYDRSYFKNGVIFCRDDLAHELVMAYLERWVAKTGELPSRITVVSSHDLELHNLLIELNIPASTISYP